MMYRNIAISAAAMFAFAACGGEQAAPAEQFGALEVRVLGVQTGVGPAATDVDEIIVTAVDSGSEAHGFQLQVDGDGDWSGTSPRLYTGNYSVTAQAFDDGEVVFESRSYDVDVPHNDTVSLTLVMNQKVPDTEYTPPHITAVLLDRTSVEQGDPINIRVTAEGGTGDYTLTGRHATSDVNANRAGEFAGGGAMVDGTGDIQWTAPMHAGDAWFVLVVTDEEGNVSELGVTVQVGDDYGFVNVGAEFNMAPTAGVRTRTLNDGDAATFYFWVDANDTDSTADLDYAWTSSCTSVNWHTDGYGAESGELQVGATNVVFKADIVGEEREVGACQFTLSMKDSNGAESRVVVTVHTLETPIETLSSEVFEDSFGDDGDFVGATTATGNGVFKWTRDATKAAKNITAPTAYFLHRAGHTEEALLGFEDMFLRTDADETDHDNFNSMDLGVLLYAHDVTGDGKFKTLAAALYPHWKAKYGYATTNDGIRLSLFGYDAYNITLGGYMAKEHGLEGADADWTTYTTWYESELETQLAADAWHTSWTNLIFDEFGIGSRDDAYLLDVDSADADVQTVAFALMSNSVNVIEGRAYLFGNLADHNYSESTAQSLYALTLH